MIPGGGDVVVGQEYTDSEKGLDDGIEGEVFGFNLLTSELSSSRLSLFRDHGNTLLPLRKPYATNSAEGLAVALRAVASYKKSIRWPEAARSSGKASKGNSGSTTISWPDNHRETGRALQATEKQVRDESLRLNPGLELVEKSYRQCAAMRGSPVEKSRLLVAWASTPVRVFGGAIIKKARPVCGDF